MSAEARFKSKFRKAARARGIHVTSVHQSGYSMGGISDELLCCRGLFIAVEVKDVGKHPTALQFGYLRKVVAAGGAGVVLRCDCTVAFVLPTTDQISDLQYIEAFDMNALLELLTT